jgi:hypothetical protein
MHAAKLVRPEDFVYGTLYSHGRKIQLAESLTRSHKSLSGVVRRATVKQVLQ